MIFIPQYLSTKYAAEETGDRQKISVQHHHAHLASVMAEHNLAGQVIGLIYDGTGYGTDGKLWGGEILVGDMAEYSRAAHLLYTPLPGGQKAIHEPWRMALSCLRAVYDQGEIEKIAPNSLLDKDWQILISAINKGINAPLTIRYGQVV